MTGREWPGWARAAVTAVLLGHMAAILAAELKEWPSSELEQEAGRRTLPYISFINQEIGHRYYAPEPGPTPVVQARLRFADGRPEEVIRLPEQGQVPRLRFQRRLALAFRLYYEGREVRMGQTGEWGPWAASYARHLCRTHPGCSGVTLHAQMHLIPSADRVREAALKYGRLDLDGEEFYSPPELIGDFECDELR